MWSQNNSNTFKKFFCTLADNLLANLLPPSLIFGLLSVRQYYEKNLKLSNPKFKFTFVSANTALKLLKYIDKNKAEGLDNLSSKFLKDVASLFAKPFFQIRNFSIKYSIFPSDLIIAKLKLLFYQPPGTIAPYPYSLKFLK